MDGGKVRYENLKWWTFEPEMSDGQENDTVWSVNLPYVVSTHIVHPPYVVSTAHILHPPYVVSTAHIVHSPYVVSMAHIVRPAFAVTMCTIIQADFSCSK